MADGESYMMPHETAAQAAASELAEWIRQNPDPENEGGLKISRDDPGVVVVYWRGAPPKGLRRLAARQSVPVIFFQAAYSLQELIEATQELLDANPDLLSSGGLRATSPASVSRSGRRHRRVRWRSCGPGPACRSSSGGSWIPSRCDVGGWWLGGWVEITELSGRLEKLSVRYGEIVGFERDPDWFLLKLQEEMGELTQAYLQHSGRARTKGLAAEQIRDNFHQEFADVICQLILLARQFDVDLPREIQRKWLDREI